MTHGGQATLSTGRGFGPMVPRCASRNVLGYSADRTTCFLVKSSLPSTDLECIPLSGLNRASAHQPKEHQSPNVLRSD